MPDEWTMYKDAATLIETKIGHELNLIGQRMTWLVLSESFLFAAWINIANAQSISRDHQTTLYNVISMIGVSSAVAALIATRAALLVGDQLLLARRHAEDGLRRLALADGHKLFPPLGSRREGRTRYTHISGAVAAAFLPPLFMGAWAALALESEGCVKDPVRAFVYPTAGALVLGALLLCERWSRRVPS